MRKLSRGMLSTDRTSQPLPQARAGPQGVPLGEGPGRGHPPPRAPNCAFPLAGASSSADLRRAGGRGGGGAGGGNGGADAGRVGQEDEEPDAGLQVAVVHAAPQGARVLRERGRRPEEPRGATRDHPPCGARSPEARPCAGLFGSACRIIPPGTQGPSPAAPFQATLPDTNARRD